MTAYSGDFLQMYLDTIIPTFSPHREALLTLCRMFYLQASVILRLC